MGDTKGEENPVLPLQIKVAENVLAMLKAGEGTTEFCSSLLWNT